MQCDYNYLLKDNIAFSQGGARSWEGYIKSTEYDDNNTVLIPHSNAEGDTLPLLDFIWGNLLKTIITEAVFLFRTDAEIIWKHVKPLTSNISDGQIFDKLLLNFSIPWHYFLSTSWCIMLRIYDKMVWVIRRLAEK